MASRDELYTALRNADAAGDTEAATRLAQYIRTLPADEPAAPAPPPAPVAPAGPPADAWSRTGDVGAGSNAGIAGLLGLPVDTALNVWDMGKAAIGTAQGAVTGKPPSEIFDPANRSQYPGSSEYIREQFNKVPTGVLNTNISHPEDAASRYLYTAGTALPAAALSMPQTLGQTVKAVGANMLPAMTGRVGADVTKGTAYENSIPMLTQLTSQLRPGGAARAMQTKMTSGELTGAQRAALEAGEELGMQTTPGYKTGNKALQKLEAKLESQPWTSGPFDKLKRNNIEKANAAWAKAIGEKGKSVDSSVLEAASERLGNNFEKARNPDSVVKVDPKATPKFLDDLDAETQGVITGSVRDNPIVKEMEATLSQGTANGKQLGAWSSKLGKRAHKELSSPGGDRYLGEALYRVKDHVDDVLGQGMSKAEAAAYADTRKQYRAFKQLTARVGNVNPNTGNVNPDALANYLQQTDKNGYLLGKNPSPHYNAVRYAQAFKPIVGDSGTATRSMNAGDVALFAPGIAANLVTRAYAGLGKAPKPVSQQNLLSLATADATAPEQRRQLIEALRKKVNE